MLRFDRHRRFRDRLSASIDGQLNPRQAGALEAHLASCAGCRRHLEELRATVAALRDLPQEEVPRSFALTPQHIARPAAGARVAPAQALTTGLRLAGVALAFALAVVLIADLGGIGGGGGGQEAARTAPLDLSAVQGESERVAATNAEDVFQSYDVTSAGPSPAAGTAGGPAAGGAVQTETPAAGLTPEPKQAAAPSPTPEPPIATVVPGRPGTTPLPGEYRILPDGTIVVPSIAEAGVVEANPTAETVPAREEDSIDALRAAEIALALALGLTLGGIVALAYAGRRG
ncbi:MAG: zf-HC2 domain-containing protein [Chloroflexi bacterium]|nr:zf-HC2 domain-containing protein [Chloroflexota bacterium]